MPIGFYRLSTDKPPYQGDPKGLHDFVTGVVASAGARLEGMYFDIGREVAWVIVEGLDDYVSVKAVSSILGADGFEKFVRVEQAEQAIARQNELGSSAD